MNTKIHFDTFSCNIRYQLAQFIDSVGHYTTEDGVEFVVLTEAKFLAVYGCDRCVNQCQQIIDKEKDTRDERIRLSMKLSCVFPDESSETVKKKRTESTNYELIDPQIVDGIVTRWRDFLNDLHQMAMRFVDDYQTGHFFEDMKTVLSNTITTNKMVVRYSEKPVSTMRCDLNSIISKGKWIPVGLFPALQSAAWAISMSRNYHDVTHSVHRPKEPFCEPFKLAAVARSRWTVELMPALAHEIVRVGFSLASTMPVVQSSSGILNFDPRLFISMNSVLIRECSSTVFVTHGKGKWDTMPRLKADIPARFVNMRAYCANIARVIALLYIDERLSPTFEYTGTPAAITARLSIFDDALLPEFYELVCKLARGTIANETEAHVLIDAAFSHQVRGLSLWKMGDAFVENSMSLMEFTDITCAYEGVEVATRHLRTRFLPSVGVWRGSMEIAVEHRLLRQKNDGETDVECIRRIARTLLVHVTDLYAWCALYNTVLSKREFPFNQPDIKFSGEIQIGSTPMREFLCSSLTEYMTSDAIDPIFKYDEALGIVELRRDMKSRTRNVEGMDMAMLHLVTFFLTSATTPPFVFGPALLYAAAGLSYDATAIASLTFLLDSRWHGRIDIEETDDCVLEKTIYAEQLFANHRSLFDRIAMRRWQLTDEVERHIPRLRIPDFLSVLCNGISFTDYAFLSRKELTIGDVRGALIVTISKNAARFATMSVEFANHLFEHYGPEHFEFMASEDSCDLSFSQLFFDVEQEQNRLCERTRALRESTMEETRNLITFDYLIRFILSSDFETVCRLYKAMTDEERPPPALLLRARITEIEEWMGTYLSRINVREIEDVCDIISFDPRMQLAISQLANFSAGSVFDITIKFVTTANWRPGHVTIPSALTCSRELVLRENSSYTNFCAGMQTFISQCNQFSMV